MSFTKIDFFQLVCEFMDKCYYWNEAGFSINFISIFNFYK